MRPLTFVDRADGYNGAVMQPSIEGPKHWRKRAKEARALAEQMHDELCKDMMLRVANDYERIAKHIEERNGRPHQGGRKRG